MTSTKVAMRQYLVDAGYRIGELKSQKSPVLVFENATVLGFAFFYSDSTALFLNWRSDCEQILREMQFKLRQAGEKAWNTYAVFLADRGEGRGDAATLQAIEEDLVGTRKIARTGVRNLDALRHALLPLLAIQNAPRLDPIDMRKEIRRRTSELPNTLVERFVGDATDAAVAELLEAGP